MKSKIPGRKK